jgi:hypothetical protein
VPLISLQLWPCVVRLAATQACCTLIPRDTQRERRIEQITRTVSNVALFAVGVPSLFATRSIAAPTATAPTDSTVATPTTAAATVTVITPTTAVTTEAVTALSDVTAQCVIRHRHDRAQQPSP